ncbi:glycosyltransferase [Actinokineospora auranticolor]|uniref:MGT family glycosyltransferase n=1 Tax=Actinokineospora auranticolor TaxID=155976 RepID=A0A2S6H1L7_9PSEU|nr:macrolide family glycosyltransferase [Actinokineospora auranticolor]PPK71307.1 MGT family glycosyltransferase [Actinokineospora auranticolor]
MGPLLFVTLFGHGHVTPTLALVAELVRRGHRVEYATGAEHAEAVVGAGARWVELPRLPDFRPGGPNPAESWFRHYFAAIRAAHPVLLRHCRANRPRLLCYDATNWQGRVVARQWEIPALRYLPHLASNASFQLMDLTPVRVLAPECARFAREHGVDLDVTTVVEAPERQSLVFVPAEFQPAAESFDDTFHFVGPMLGRRAEEEWSPRHGDQPLLYVALGSMMSDPALYRTCATDFTDGAWQVAMNARDTGPVPPNFDVRPWFPQPAVLRHARAFVTHAGMNSTMEALTHGVPLIAVPQTPEQAINADRVEELGLGVRLKDLSALREVVDHVANDRTIRHNLAEMRAAIETSGGATRAADIIEACC